MLAFIALIVLGLVLWKSFSSRPKRIDPTKYKAVPAPPGYPVVGNLWELMTSNSFTRLPLFKKHFDKYGPCFLLHGFGVTMVQASSAEFMKFLLSTNKFINKGDFYRVVMPWLGTGLVTASGATWRKHRKMLHPAFHFTILNNLCNTVSQKCEILIKKLDAESNSEGFNATSHLYCCSMDVIAETAMNIHLNTQSGHSKSFFESIKRFIKLAGDRAANVLLHPDIFHRFSNNYKSQQECLEVLQGVSTKMILEKMKEHKEKEVKKTEASDSTDTSEKKKCLIEILLNVSDPVTGSLSLEEIRDEVNTFLFAGHDTVATSLSWTLLLLGNHPEIQKKMCEELDEVFGNSDRWPTNEDLRRLKYVEYVYLESLRMYPPIPFITRIISEDVVVDDYLIRAGTVVAIHIHRTHRSPEHYPNPDKFDPSNFYPENVKERHPYAFIAFSAGPRNCIGQKYAMIEAKTILTQIFRNFEIESVYRMDEITPVPDIIMTPDKGVQIKVRRRIKN